MEAGGNDRLGFDAQVKDYSLCPWQHHVELGFGVATGVGVDDSYQVEELLHAGHVVNDGAWM